MIFSYPGQFYMKSDFLGTREIYTTVAGPAGLVGCSLTEKSRVAI